MLLSMGIVLWFLCGLLAVYLAFTAARMQKDIFDPAHIWLAMLGPLGLIPACLVFALSRQRSRPIVS